jgi:RNA polymerase sigma-70 factor (ECF subfamily)
MSLLNENNLIARCRMGESAAFGPLVKIYRQRLFSYLFKLSGDRKLAEDLFQETLIKIWRGLPKYSEQNKFSSWIFSIAHNAAMDTIRTNNKNRVFEHAVEPDNFAGTTNPYQEIIDAETSEMISNAVDKLPAKQKEVFLLRIHGGMTFKEIAEITGESLNTVLSHMHYAVKKLRNTLRFQNAE